MPTPQEQPNDQTLSQAVTPAKRSYGEKVFDWIVYGGIGFALNATISTIVAHRAAYYPESWLHKTSQKFTGFLHKNVFVPMENKGLVKNADWHAHFWNDVSFLSSGGWLLLAPMKWMEDAKSSIVRSLDKYFGTTPETSEQQAAYDKHLDNQPQQSYFSLVTGRLGGITMVYLAALPIMKFTPLGNWTKDAVNATVGNSLKRFRKPDELGHYIGFEIILSAVSTAVLYAVSKVTAWTQYAMTHKLPADAGPPVFTPARDPIDAAPLLAFGKGRDLTSAELPTIVDRLLDKPSLKVSAAIADGRTAEQTAEQSLQNAG